MRRVTVVACQRRRVGQPREAAAEHKAVRLLARCEGAVAPPVLTITARARLTPSELDAAVQAAGGRSNKQIATVHASIGAMSWPMHCVASRRPTAELLSPEALEQSRSVALIRNPVPARSAWSAVRPTARRGVAEEHLGYRVEIGGNRVGAPCGGV